MPQFRCSGSLGDGGNFALTWASRSCVTNLSVRLMELFQGEFKVKASVAVSSRSLQAMCSKLSKRPATIDHQG